MKKPQKCQYFRTNVAEIARLLRKPSLLVLTFLALVV
jgi:hypothetical protein